MHPPIIMPFLPEQLLEKQVYDADGEAVGRIRAVEPAEGGAHAVDVALVERLAQELAIEDAWIPATAIVSAEEVVMLHDDARHVLHPEASNEDFLPPDESR